LFRELDERIRPPVPDGKLWTIEIIGVVYIINQHHSVRLGSAQRHIAEDVLGFGHLVIVIQHVRRRQLCAGRIAPRSQTIDFT
jgi:hypothetical protein